MAQDMYLQLKGIEGASTRAGREGWIEVSAASWGVAQVDPGAGRRRMNVAARPLSVTAPVEAASALLFEAIAAGTAISTATLDVEAPNESGASTVVLSWTLENVVVASLDIDASDASVQTFALEAERVRLSVAGSARGQSVPTVRGWDFARNRRW
ncbi:type VI secretion system tube protein Hcp [Microbacterium sp. C7(2022)]|uniref:Hcp family type VI secretion system effector n=1 Tax=Microbacterium sp. C7(2022) TaxID=2992759 RepID=UPI00237B607E|nr:type VI secretion system tube protein Hcp [Microbacterium sp. C7(2022)]MDE0546587.1 type VI secretion system tube protein Hcp [Microbacterium sp. C7(2022)]